MAVVGSSVGRISRPSVGRQAEQVAQLGLGNVQRVERLFGGTAEKEILLACLGLFFGLAAGGADACQRRGLPPRLQRAVAAGNDRIEAAILEVQFPVGCLDVADQVADARLEVGHRDVGIEPVEDDAVEESRLGPRPGDSVELHARPLQQRLPPFGHEVHVPIGGIRQRRQLLAGDGIDVGKAVAIVRHVVGDRKLAAGRRHLRQFRLERPQVVLRDRGKEIRERCVDVSRRVGPLPQHAAGKLGVEGRQRRLGAGPRIGLGQRGIVDRRHQLGIAEDEVRRSLHLAADVAHHLVVSQGDIHRLFQREAPDFLFGIVGQRKRPLRPATSASRSTSTSGYSMSVATPL